MSRAPSKTEVSLLQRMEEARAKGETTISVSTRWECTAARRLADQGLAKSYKSLTEHRYGESYYNHFHRCYATRKTYVAWGGILTL